MKTYRQAFVGKLESAIIKADETTTATIEHLLLLCDMLDGQADQFRDVAKLIETPAEHVETVRQLERKFRDGDSVELERHSFADELVERLERVVDSMHENNTQHKQVVCAILSDLAAMPCELPTSDDFKDEFIEGKATESQARWLGELAGAMIRTHIQPILAAKDAELAKLRAIKESSNAIIASFNFDANKAAESRRLLLVENEQLRVQIAALQKGLATPIVDAYGQVIHSPKVDADFAKNDAEIARLQKVVRLQNKIAEDHVSRIDQVRGNYKSAVETIQALAAGSADLEARLTVRDAQYNTLLLCKDAMCIPRDEVCDLPARIRLMRSSQANKCSNAERAQYELTIEQQKAKIFDLEREVARKSRIVVDETELANAQIDRAEAALLQVVELKKRIAELESRTPAYEAQTPQRTWNVCPSCDRLADIPEECMPGARFNCTECGTGLYAELFTDGSWQLLLDSNVDGPEHIAELTAHVGANGNTPGQVAYEMWSILPGTRQYSDPDEWKICKPVEQTEWNVIAKAVLHAFGNGAETLKRVRDKVRSATWGVEGYKLDHSAIRVDVLGFIDAELAKLA